MDNPKYIQVMRQVASDFDGISHELFQVASDLERMDQYNPQQKLFSLVRSAEVSSVTLRNLTARTVRDDAVVPDPNKIYYYAAHELRVAIEEYSPESVSKSSRTIGIIVKGRCCFFLYFTGSTRMYWMKNSEENYAAAVKSLLLARGFGITSIHQIVIGSTMSVAQRLCHGAKPFGNKYFVVSTFFAQCLFLTNNKEGDALLKLILHDELAMEINHAALSPFHPPRIPTREYDAIETSLDRPVLLNYQCDLLMLSDIHPMPEGFRGSPIMLCFDYQTQVIQRILGPAIEVRPLESRLDYG